MGKEGLRVIAMAQGSNKGDMILCGTYVTEFVSSSFDSSVGGNNCVSTSLLFLLFWISVSELWRVGHSRDPFSISQTLFCGAVLPPVSVPGSIPCVSGQPSLHTHYLTDTRMHTHIHTLIHTHTHTHTYTHTQTHTHTHTHTHAPTHSHSHSHTQASSASRIP